MTGLTTWSCSRKQGRLVRVVPNDQDEENNANSDDHEDNDGTDDTRDNGYDMLL